jgi:hypothetical protein
MSDYEVAARWDDSSLGRTWDHFVFPSMTDKTTGHERATADGITGGLYVRKGQMLPDRIIITLDRG